MSALTGEAFVYRLYADDGSLLYVGVSMEVERRIRSHLLLQGWADQIATHTVEGPYPTGEAVTRERQAILGESPTHNVARYPALPGPNGAFLFRREDVEALLTPRAGDAA